MDDVAEKKAAFAFTMPFTANDLVEGILHVHHGLHNFAPLIVVYDFRGAPITPDWTSANDANNVSIDLTLAGGTSSGLGTSL